jgi:hypothetical protein
MGDAVIASITTGLVGLLTLTLTKLLDARGESLRARIERDKQFTAWKREDAVRWLAEQRALYRDWQASARRAVRATRLAELSAYKLTRVAEGKLKNLELGPTLTGHQQSVHGLGEAIEDLEARTADIQLLGHEHVSTLAVEALEAIRTGYTTLLTGTGLFEMTGDWEHLKLPSGAVINLEDTIERFVAAAVDRLSQPS